MEIYEKLLAAIKAHSGLEDSEIMDAGNYGADCGWAGFCYTRDCVEFYEKNTGLIWELALDMAESMGCKNVIEMVAGFRRSDMLNDPDQFANLMAWFALEEVGLWLAGNPQDEDEDTE